MEQVSGEFRSIKRRSVRRVSSQLESLGPDGFVLMLFVRTKEQVGLRPINYSPCACGPFEDGPLMVSGLFGGSRADRCHSGI